MLGRVGGIIIDIPKSHRSFVCVEGLTESRGIQERHSAHEYEMRQRSRKKDAKVPGKTAGTLITGEKSAVERCDVVLSCPKWRVIPSCRSRFSLPTL